MSAERMLKQDLRDEAMAPVWSDDVPYCTDGCPRYDGKRCEVLGMRPDRLCSPAVVMIVKKLTELESDASIAMGES